MNTQKTTPLQDNILRLAADQHLSIAEVNRRAGLSASSVRNIVYGKSISPRGDTLQKIAKVFGVSVEDLLGIPAASTENTNTLYNAELGEMVDNLFNSYVIKNKISIPIDKARRFKKVLYNFTQQTSIPISGNIVSWYLKEHL